MVLDGYNVELDKNLCELLFKCYNHIVGTLGVGPGTCTLAVALFQAHLDQKKSIQKESDGLPPDLVQFDSRVGRKVFSVAGEAAELMGELQEIEQTLVVQIACADKATWDNTKVEPCAMGLVILSNTGVLLRDAGVIARREEYNYSALTSAISFSFPLVKQFANPFPQVIFTADKDLRDLDTTSEEVISKLLTDFNNEFAQKKNVTLQFVDSDQVKEALELAEELVKSL